MTEHRRLALLRRILQFDIEDAIARYEAEATCCIVDIRLQLDASGEFQMQLAVDSRTSNRSVVPPRAMLVFNFGRAG